MSIESWENEFYPVDACQAAGSDLEAVDHCIKKWEGLLYPNLKKHGIKKSVGNRRMHDADGSVLTVWSGSCALCVRHLSYGPDDPDCPACPLNEVRGIRCDFPLPNENSGPFVHWNRTNDPRRMIRWLKKAKALVEEKEKDETDDE